MTDLDILEQKHLQDIGSFERELERKTATRTLAEIEAALLSPPASPQTDRDLLARFAMIRRRLEILEAAKPRPNDPPPDPLGMIEVFVPEGGAGCVQSKTLRNKYYYAEMKDGRHVCRMPWSEFHALANSINNTAGPSGASWWEANPHLAARLPQNPLPPIPEPPR